MQPALQPLPNGFCGCFSGGVGCSGTAVCVVNGSRSRCKEKRFRVPDYENRTCSQRCNRCQMDFWGCFSGVAGCSGTAVCVVKGSRSRCKEKRFRVPDYENRTCSSCCSRCQMEFWSCFSGGAGCSGTAVCVVKGSRSRCKEKRLCVPDYENRTCSQRCNRCQMDFWGCSSGGAGCSGTAVCVVRAAGTGAKRNGFVCPIMKTALAASVAAVAKWISGAASLGVQVFRNGSLCSQGQPEQMQRETALCARL